MTTQGLATAPSERIPTLDTIRGIALLGILIMNIPAFSGPLFHGGDGPKPWPMWWEQTAEFTRDLLFAGRFNSMFSMLFGVGFTMQLARLLERSPDNAYWIYTRRLLWLLVFGLVHRCIFWAGDILHIYAVLGLVMFLLFHKLSDRAVVGLIVAMLLSPTVIEVARFALMTPADIEHFVAVMTAMSAADTAALGHGTFLQAAWHNAQTAKFMYTDSNTGILLLGGILQLAATMLMGLLLGRHDFFRRAGAYLDAVRRVQWWALAIGIATGLVFAVWSMTVANPGLPSPWKVLSRFCFSMCRVSVTIFYVSLIVRAMYDATWRQRLQPMAIAGRMPLTNYLMQTLICTSIFFGWGLGLWGKVGPALEILMAFAIFFLVQVPFSKWWLARFEVGPMEYLWRTLTYGRSASRSMSTPSSEAERTA